MGSRGQTGRREGGKVLFRLGFHNGSGCLSRGALRHHQPPGDPGSGERGCLRNAVASGQAEDV